MTHKESNIKFPPPQDYIRINKLAVKNRAVDHYVSKDNIYYILYIRIIYIFIYLHFSPTKNSEEILISNKRLLKERNINKSFFLQKTSFMEKEIEHQHQ